MTAFLCCTILRKCEAKLSVECAVDYLKFRHFDDDYFASVKSYTGTPSECSDDIRSTVESFYEDVRTRFNNHAARRAHTECVVKELKLTDKYEVARLAAKTADIKGVGLKFWKSGDKNKFIEKQQKIAQELEDDAFINCQGRKSYGEFFDTFFAQKKNEQVADKFDYCMRKHLQDRSFIHVGQYGFNANPKSISTQKITCDDIMRDKFDAMKAQIIADGGKQCTVDKFISNGYLDEMLKIELLSKLNMSPAEKEAEKEKFIAHMVSLTHVIKSCPAA